TVLPQGTEDLVVHTTLDRGLQAKAEAAVAAHFCDPKKTTSDDDVGVALAKIIDEKAPGLSAAKKKAAVRALTQGTDSGDDDAKLAKRIVAATGGEIDEPTAAKIVSAAKAALSGDVKCKGKASEAATLNAGQAALVSLDTTGAVRAMVGGKSYIDSQFN